MMQFRRCLLLLLLLTSSPRITLAQIVDLGGDTRASAIATMPACMDSEGGGGFTDASASCSSPDYAASATAQSSRSSSLEFGAVSAFAESAASTTSVANSGLSAVGSADASGINSWTVSVDFHYTAVIEASGGATAAFLGPAGPLPSSGVIPPDTYTLQADAAALSRAEDVGGPVFVTDGPRQSSAEVTFAAVGSPDLIQGIILAGGAAKPGLLVEALDGPTLVRVARTGNDGSYLLPDLPGPVELRISDPDGAFLTEFSELLTPPTTYNADLEAIAVPALSMPLALLLPIVLGAVGWRALHRRKQGVSVINS